MPTIPESGAMVIYSSLHRRGRFVKVGDVVTFAHPMFPNSRGCKRVIGMPGDFVSVVTRARGQDDLFEEDVGGKWASVREEVVRVPEGHCWVEGDNLEWSRDSRLFGPLPLGLVRSKVLAMVVPFRGQAMWMDGKRDVVDPGDNSMGVYKRLYFYKLIHVPKEETDLSAEGTVDIHSDTFQEVNKLIEWLRAHIVHHNQLVH
ncbi:mitochondrial inner membrane protease subunit 1 [Pyrenophora seminiperda CCB06]|uniref:Mitochondrial inner membrane protease subunit n=1 Tax=Pyrenophora seminiperda CCB06 TaxID=1302712 RepID=A0A3M7M829_9PLEO|nr:mitochondrial inner membrane protease subunit 1 [Pyrenophora seminiperda CCB06]